MDRQKISLTCPFRRPIRACQVPLLLELLKPQKYVTFADFIAGFLVAVPPLAYSRHIPTLMLVFLSFQVLVYGGIYIVNDLFDLHTDRQHPAKKRRLIARGAIRPSLAGISAIALIAAGMLLGYFIDAAVLHFAVMFVCLNLLYTWKLKNIPYIDLLTNAITHPLRVAFAVALFGQLEKENWIIVACAFLLYLALNSLRRHKELGEVGNHLRKALRGYTSGVLLAITIACGAGLLILGGFRSSIQTLSLVVVAILVYGAFLVGYGFPDTWWGRGVNYALTH
jgi:4-hydroxybenzoate polyprenyltransferase